MNDTLERINAHLAAVADLARRQQQTIDDLSAPPTTPTAALPKRGLVIWWSDDPRRFGPPLKALGLNLVRGWLTVGPGPADAAQRELPRVTAWTEAGFSPLVCVWPKPGTTTAAAGSIAATLAEQLPKDALVEIGNEPDLDSYWPRGDWRHFLDTVAIPMAERLSELRPDLRLVRPALGSIAKQMLYLPQFATAVRKMPARYQAIHPYASNAGDLPARLAGWANASDLPLVATEWDIARGDVDRWRRQINQAVAHIESRCAAHCFYRIYTRDPGSTGGYDQISLFDRDARPVEPYHGLYRQALQAAGG